MKLATDSTRLSTPNPTRARRGCNTRGKSDRELDEVPADPSPRKELGAPHERGPVSCRRTRSLDDWEGASDLGTKRSEERA
jgi:hypothetical protein